MTVTASPTQRRCGHHGAANIGWRPSLVEKKQGRRRKGFLFQPVSSLHFLFTSSFFRSSHLNGCVAAASDANGDPTDHPAKHGNHLTERKTNSEIDTDFFVDISESY